MGARGGRALTSLLPVSPARFPGASSTSAAPAVPNPPLPCPCPDPPVSLMLDDTAAPAAASGELERIGGSAGLCTAFVVGQTSNSASAACASGPFLLTHLSRGLRLLTHLGSEAALWLPPLPCLCTAPACRGPAGCLSDRGSSFTTAAAAATAADDTLLTLGGPAAAPGAGPGASGVALRAACCCFRCCCCCWWRDTH
jgi:hypothetical protein